ncbi:MAG: HypC/HybG/HupF family hydrogenase formation chaperone [Thermoleophilia bacterium]|nr:HypC/HybG/HupF family hydrogenase formation chaperone [Gaiellaceae bacterium]MDW8339759.1 HypC/HybG/HupF family hydrogenase formation chaperone [Thermoleophilia bacterium]
MTVDPRSCPSCRDEAVVARVREVDGLEAVVEVDGTEQRVGIDLVPEARRGDLLLCHAGIALEHVQAVEP